jgi:hypothetical protein
VTERVTIGCVCVAAWLVSFCGICCIGESRDVLVVFVWAWRCVGFR